MEMYKILWIGDIFGWLYFISWGISFYPQIFLNYNRKSVIGLNFDYLAFNIAGFFAYSVFNTVLYFNKNLQKEFSHLYRGKFNTVQYQDLLFSLHGFVLLIVVLIQCLIYKRGNQKVSQGCKYVLISTFLSMALLCILKISNVLTISWLLVLIILSYLKLLSTLIKYIPQVIMNWSHQSTSGWSIVNVLFDLAGGIFSLLQIFILAYAFQDWLSILRSSTKLGLGVVTIGFDIVFILQHFVWYKNEVVY